VADIFISYAREDAVRAGALAAAFVELGWSVWFDDSIRAGAPFDAVIDQQLDAAACVVVIWSRASVASNWVRAEASAADDQAKLVPIAFEPGLRVPVRFRQLQVSHLTSTDVSEPTDDARRLLADIAHLTGKRPDGVAEGGIEQLDRERTSGAYLITVGHWLLTSRALAMSIVFDLRLNPNGTASGKAKWFISRAELAGRWFFDPAEQVLHLELSGGIQEGTKAMPITITRWVTPDSAECKFDGRRSRIERVVP
jgi:hypothetical protein